MVAWRLLSTQTWVLLKFIIPSLVNPAASVNRMLVTDCVFTTHFARSHGQNTTLARWSGGCGTDKVIVHGEFSRQGEHRYLQQQQQQQQQFFAHWFQYLLPLFSIPELLEKSPISQQALISGHVLTGNFLLIW
jgi:hypothetical protein